MQVSTEESVRLAAAAAADKLADDIVAVDVTSVFALVDAFVLCTANNPRQADAVINEVEHRMRAAGAKRLTREGDPSSGWVLIDFGDVVVHVLLPEQRAEYGLERLWRDCPTIDLRRPEAAS